MEYKSFKCPECGANIDNINASFCSSCGVKLQFDDGTKNINYNYNYKTEDMAKIKEIEVNRELELNKMKEKKKEDIRGLIICLLVLPLIICFYIGFNYIILHIF